VLHHVDDRDRPRVRRHLRADVVLRDMDHGLDEVRAVTTLMALLMGVDGAAGGAGNLLR
jgi:hypothetical protein